ncbi:MAG TPA: CheR family methyltransferase [Opitutaceae bacterium]|nr:CheR family methyltransferase [Opitutaceae bacterium]
MPTAEEKSPPISVTPGIPLLLRDLVHEQAGIYFEPDRLDLLLDKLRDRARARDCRSFLDYYYLLKYDEHAGEEWLRVMDAFSVQETYFWREAAQIEALVEIVVPAWFREHRSLPLHIWSAACATGEEPYSLAIALRETGWSAHPIFIHASDASEAALEKARTAVYRERSFRALAPELRAKYFEPAPEGARLRRELLTPVSFQRVNLVSPAETAALATAPVIFCRNVFIYFSPEAIRRTVASFATRMPGGGHLFVGASESLLRLTDDFEMREIGDAFVYVRRDLNAPPAP